MPHVSPSQINTWRRCQRWWAYSRVHREPDNRYTAFGTAAHTVAEAWLERGTAPDPSTPEGRTILAGLHYLPPPGAAVVEHKWDFDWGGVQYTGRIDFLYGYQPQVHVVIADHKTTGNFDFMADLAVDPQRIIYAAWAAMALDVRQVTAQWVYYLRALGRAVPEARVRVYQESREQIMERFEDLHTRYSLPLLRAHEEPIDSRPRTPGACGTMGGCPHQDRCWEGVPQIDRALADLT